MNSKLSHALVGLAALTAGALLAPLPHHATAATEEVRASQVCLFPAPATDGGFEYVVAGEAELALADGGVKRRALQAHKGRLSETGAQCARFIRDEVQPQLAP